MTNHPGDGRLAAGRADVPAAHALALGAVLVTHNTREFSRVPALAVEDWG